MDQQKRSPLFLIALMLLVMVIGAGFSVIALKRPCHYCKHPPHVSRICNVEVKSGTFKGRCSCSEDR